MPAIPVRPLASLALVGALAMSACSSSSEDDTDTAGSAEGYPVTLDNCGREVTVEAPPERAVSLNQGSTEILLSLGLADRMVGTATWTDPVREGLEEENDKVERLADNAPSYERVLETESDLVTASFLGTLGEGGVTTPEALEELGVPSYLSPAECGKGDATSEDGSRDDTLEIETVYREVTDLAEIFGVQEEGEELVDDLRSRMDAAAEQAPADEVSILYWFANSESPYMAGCCGAPGIINRALGLDNVFDDSQEEWPQINWETVATRDPDVIVIGDLTRESQTAETAAAKIDFLKNHPVASEMTAVKENRFIELTGAAMNPSIRTVDGVEQVAEGLRELGLSQ